MKISFKTAKKLAQLTILVYFVTSEVGDIVIAVASKQNIEKYQMLNDLHE